MPNQRKHARANHGSPKRRPHHAPSRKGSASWAPWLVGGLVLAGAGILYVTHRSAQSPMAAQASSAAGPTSHPAAPATASSSHPAAPADAAQTPSHAAAPTAASTTPSSASAPAAAAVNERPQGAASSRARLIEDRVRPLLDGSLSPNKASAAFKRLVADLHDRGPAALDDVLPLLARTEPPPFQAVGVQLLAELHLTSARSTLASIASDPQRDPHVRTTAKQALTVLDSRAQAPLAKRPAAPGNQATNPNPTAKATAEGATRGTQRGTSKALGALRGLAGGD